MIRVALYVRVSSAEQVGGTSLDGQERECLAYCERNGWAVVGAYRDAGESARSTDRPGFLALLGAAKTGVLDKVLVHKLDRFARDSHDFAVCRAMLAGDGVQLVSATEPITDDPSGRFLETILSAVAQLDNEVRAERSRAGMAARARAGYWCHKAPLGFRIDRTPAGPVLRPDDYAPIVREVFEGLAGGALDARSAAERLRAETAPRVWQREDVRRMVREPAYVGRIQSKLTGGRPVTAAWPAMISEETWEGAQARVDGVRIRQARPADLWPLRGWLTCGECGGRITGAFSRGRHGGRYGYYQCQRGHVRLPRDAAHEAFRSQLKAAVSKCRPVVRLLRLMVRDVWETERDEQQAKADAARRQASVVEGKQRRLLDALLAGVIDEETYRGKAAELRAQKAASRDDSHAADLRQIDADAVLDIADALFLDADRIWVHADPADRRALQVAFFGESVQVDAAGSYRTPENPCIYALCAAISAPDARVAPPRGDLSNLVAALSRVLAPVARLVA